MYSIAKEVLKEIGCQFDEVQGILIFRIQGVEFYLGGIHNGFYLEIRCFKEIKGNEKNTSLELANEIHIRTANVKILIVPHWDLWGDEKYLINVRCERFFNINIPNPKVFFKEQLMSYIKVANSVSRSFCAELDLYNKTGSFSFSELY